MSVDIQLLAIFFLHESHNFTENNSSNPGKLEEKLSKTVNKCKYGAVRIYFFKISIRYCHQFSSSDFLEPNYLALMFKSEIEARGIMNFFRV